MKTLFWQMRFLKTYRTRIITQKPGLTTYFDVSDELSFLWERANFPPLQRCKMTLLYQSTPNFERLITWVRWRDLQNLVAIGSKGTSPHVGEIYNFLIVVCVFSFSFFDQATDHNSQRILLSSSTRILMYYGSKDVVWWKDVPFEYPKC